MRKTYRANKQILVLLQSRAGVWVSGACVWIGLFGVVLFVCVCECCLRVLVSVAAQCQWNCQPIWYGHHESNLVSNLFINIRDANKLKGKGHSVNNTTAARALAPWKLDGGTHDEAWNENKNMNMTMETMKAKRIEPVLRLLSLCCSCLPSSFILFRSRAVDVLTKISFATDRCRIPAKLINFQLISCFPSDNDAYPSLFWRNHRQVDPFFSPPPYIIIINDWLRQPFLLWPLGLACYDALFFSTTSNVRAIVLFFF